MCVFDPNLLAFLFLLQNLDGQSDYCRAEGSPTGLQTVQKDTIPILCCVCPLFTCGQLIEPLPIAPTKSVETSLRRVCLF